MMKIRSLESLAAVCLLGIAAGSVWATADGMSGFPVDAPVPQSSNRAGLSGDVRVEPSFASIGAASQISFFAVAGSSDTDEGNFASQTADGGFVGVGSTMNSAGDFDLLLVKSDSSGAFDWAVTVGGSDNDYGGGGQQTADGGYIAVGSTASFGTGGSDVFLVKFGAGGDVEWAKTAGGSGEDSGSKVEQTVDGGYIVVGVTGSFGAGMEDILLLKYDASGALTWAKTAGGSSEDGALSVQQTSDQGYLVAGSTSSFGAGESDFLTVKFDASGTLVWAKTAGGIDPDAALSARQDAGDGYIVAGGTRSFGVGTDALVVKYSANGALEWATTAGGPGIDTVNAVLPLADGSYLAAGNTGSFGAGSNDIWLMNFSADGNLTWSRTAGGVDDEHCYSVQLAADGGYVIAGTTQSYGAGSGDMVLLKTTSDGLVQNCSAVATCSPSTTSPALTVGEASLLTSVPLIVEQTQTIVSTPVTLVENVVCEPSCDLGVELLMPSHEFTSGSLCSLTALLCNPGPQVLTDVNLFVFLDIGVGEYWFAPGWNHYPPDLDYYPLANVPLGATEMSILPEFTWPSGAGGLNGLIFYGALTDAGITQVIGNLGSWTFSSL